MLFISNKLFKNVKYLFLLLITLFAILYISNQKDVILKHFYPTKYEEYVNQYAKEYSLDPYLVYSIIRVESNYDELANSHKDAKGLMQITDSTGEWAAKKIKIKNYNEQMLFEPKYNIMIGCWYLNNLIEQFDGNTTLALAAYNAGSGNVVKWLQDKEYSADGSQLDKIPFGETEKYLSKVKKDYSIYRSLYLDNDTNTRQEK